MVAAARRESIVAILQGRRAVRVSALSEELGVASMTIRRDLQRLQSAGLAERSHGGAMLTRHLIGEPLYAENVRAHSEEKRRIAAAAAALIEPGETVFLGSGTTIAQVLGHLDADLPARIITHNLGALAEASALRAELVLLGGHYRRQSNAVEGSLPLELLHDFYADKVFLGPDGLSLAEGATTPSIGVAAVERAMLAHTRGELVVLADASKIGAVSHVAVCPLERIDLLIVDDGIAVSLLDEFQELGMRVMVA
jgi:DeoR family transcriptional regulator of aga operon